MNTNFSAQKIFQSLPKIKLTRVIAIQLALIAGALTFTSPAKAQWSCQNGFSNSSGSYKFCVNNDGGYIITYASGTWIMSRCGATTVTRKGISEYQAATFHRRVCAIPSGGGTNYNDVTIEMMRILGQQYIYK